jgi:hypothetical protein
MQAKARTERDASVDEGGEDAKVMQAEAMEVGGDERVKVMQAKAKEENKVMQAEAKEEKKLMNSEAKEAKHTGQTGYGMQVRHALGAAPLSTRSRGGAISDAT